MLIDMAVPSDRDTSVKVAEKLSKYKDLDMEIARMWGMKTKMVPVVIGQRAYRGKCPKTETFRRDPG